MTTATAAPQTLTDRRRWIALAVLSSAFLMVVLDTTIVSVALPTIQDDLGLSAAGVAWVVNAYLIAFGGLLLLAGRLGDLLGRTRVFGAGLAVFLLASLLGGLAQSEAQLVAARALQGVGGALASAVILGMVVTLFPEPRERAKAIAVYAFVGSAGASLGTVLGGVLTDAIDWHWIFFVNLPIGALTAFGAVRVLERDAGLGLAARGADVLGALLIVAALMLGVWTIVGTADHGWGSARTLGLGALSLALLAAFVAREARAAQPLVPLRVFRLPGVSAANLVQGLLIAGMFGQQFVVALLLQRVLGLQPVEVGLAMVPIPLAIGVVSLGFAARLMERFGAKAMLLAGQALIAAGLLVLARVPVDAAYAADLLAPLVVMGVGAGLALPAITTLAMAGAGPEDAGVVSGLANTTQQVGGAIGLAVLTTFSASRTDARLDAGAGAVAALTSGYRLAFAIAAGLAVVSAVVAVATLRTPAPAAPAPDASAPAPHAPAPHAPAPPAAAASAPAAPASTH